MKKILLLLILVLMSISVIAVAPSSVTIEAPQPFVLYDLEIVSVYYSVVDTDTAILNCSLYFSNQTFDAFTLQNPELSSTDANVLNDTVTSFNLDITGYQDADVEQRIYYQINCSDGIDQEHSVLRYVNARPLFYYSDGDIASSVVSTFVKTFITIGLFVTFVVIGLILIFGYKKFKR